jgi:hypothetical protein
MDGRMEIKFSVRVHARLDLTDHAAGDDDVHDSLRRRFRLLKFELDAERQPRHIPFRLHRAHASF